MTPRPPPSRTQRPPRSTRSTGHSSPPAPPPRSIAWSPGSTSANDARALLDALLLKARYDLGLPARPGRQPRRPPRAGAVASTRTATSRRSAGSAASCSTRATSSRPGPISASSARRTGSPGRSTRIDPSGEPGDERLGQVVDVAFNQGVHPQQGFELILDHYGACSAITAFEHLPPDEATRIACADTPRPQPPRPPRRQPPRRDRPTRPALAARGDADRRPDRRPRLALRRRRLPHRRLAPRRGRPDVAAADRPGDASRWPSG